MKRTYGLIGFPLNHSFSPSYFQSKFKHLGLSDHAYELFPLKKIENLPGLLSSRPDIAGLNVTIPYKKLVFPFIDQLDKEAEEIGAINTITVFRNRGEISLKGSNTDYLGLLKSIKPFLDHSVNQALILGNGGAAQAVRYALTICGLNTITVSRTVSKPSIITWNMLDAELVQNCQLIVQCTPVGLNQNDPLLPFPYHALGKQHILIDLIYNPEITPFLNQGLIRGCRIKNGLEMLYEQAEASWRIWNEYEPPTR